MAISYELMDLDSGNLVGSYLTLNEAFAVIRDAYGLYGWTRVRDLGLVKVGEHETQELVAVGAELAHLALGEDNSAVDGQRRERTA
jgi:hypothetical protein